MSKTSPEITIATANVHFGDMIREAGGLDPLEQYKPDILLLQEVANPQDELERQLGIANYNLVHAIGEFGLAVAVRANSKISLVAGSVRTQELGKMGPTESMLAQKWARRPHDITAHGMQAAKFKMANDQVITVVTTRVTVSSNRVARKRQINAIGKELASSYYDGPLVLGGDMNHFPRPQAVDRAMYEHSRLLPVNLDGEPTWRARKSPLYITAALIRRQRVENMSAELDTILYRPDNLEPVRVNVVDTVSDHRAIVSTFKYREPS